MVLLLRRHGGNFPFKEIQSTLTNLSRILLLTIGRKLVTSAGWIELDGHKTDNSHTGFDPGITYKTRQKNNSLLFFQTFWLEKLLFFGA